MSKTYPLAAVLVLGCLLAACGQDKDQAGNAEQASSAQTALIEAMVNREEIAQRASGLTLAELFPDAGHSKVLDDAFRADVVSVDAGRAFGDHMDADPNTGVEVRDFDDPEASWRSFHVRVKVVEVYSGDVEVGTELTLGLAFGRGLDEKVVSEGLMSMGQIVALTALGDFVVPYDPSITPVVWDGAFLSPVEGELVPWPAVSEGEGPEASMVSRFDTLPELRQIGSA